MPEEPWNKHTPGALLCYEEIDAIRLKAFRTNDPATKQRFLEAAGRWFQYEADREMERSKEAPMDREALVAVLLDNDLGLSLSEQQRTEIADALIAAGMIRGQGAQDEAVQRLIKAANQARLAFAGFVSARSAIDMLDEALAAVQEGRE